MCLEHFESVQNVSGVSWMCLAFWILPECVWSVLNVSGAFWICPDCVWSVLNVFGAFWILPKCVWSALNVSVAFWICPEFVWSILNVSGANWMCLELPECVWSFLNVSGVSRMCLEHIEYVPNVSRATLTAISLEPRISRNTRWLYCLQCFTYTLGIWGLMCLEPFESFLNVSGGFWMCLEPFKSVPNVSGASWMCLELFECDWSLLNVSWMCLEHPECVWRILNVSGASWMYVMILYGGRNYLSWGLYFESRLNMDSSSQKWKIKKNIANVTIWSDPPHIYTNSFACLSKILSPFPSCLCSKLRKQEVASLSQLLLAS